MWQQLQEPPSHCSWLSSHASSIWLSGGGKSRAWLRYCWLMTAKDGRTGVTGLVAVDPTLSRKGEGMTRRQTETRVTWRWMRQAHRYRHYGELLLALLLLRLQASQRPCWPCGWT
jgi:hypothetical protein